MAKFGRSRRVRRLRPKQEPVRLFSASAVSSAVRIQLAAADLAVGLLHEVFELILKTCVCRRPVHLSFHSRNRLLSRPLDSRSGTIRASILPLRARLSFRSLRRRQRLFDGKIDLSGLVYGNDLHLDRVAQFQIVVDVADVCVCDLRNMYQAAGAAGQLNKRSEFCDPGYFSLQDRPYFKIHALPFSLL